jgi:hypothetical protein
MGFGGLEQGPAHCGAAQINVRPVPLHVHRCTSIYVAQLMKLLTAELRLQLPPLYSQEKREDPAVHRLMCRRK